MSSSLLIDYSQSEPHYQLQNYAELPTKHLTPLLLAGEAQAVHKLKTQDDIERSIIEHQALSRQSDKIGHQLSHTGCFQYTGLGYEQLTDILLPKNVWTHGQIYVAFSRCGNPNNIFVWAEQSQFTGEDCDLNLDPNKKYVKNVVYREVIEDIDV